MEIWRLYVRDDIVLLTTVFLICNFHRRGLRRTPSRHATGFSLLSRKLLFRVIVA